MNRFKILCSIQKKQTFKAIIFCNHLQKKRIYAENEKSLVKSVINDIQNIFTIKNLNRYDNLIFKDENTIEFDEDDKHH